MWLYKKILQHIIITKNNKGNNFCELLSVFGLILAYCNRSTQHDNALWHWLQWFEEKCFKKKIYAKEKLNHSHKKRKDSLETRAELAVLRTYVENQAKIELIFLYRASKCKQTKKQDSEDCLRTHIFTFL